MSDSEYIIRRLPACNAEGVPYPEATVPPLASVPSPLFKTRQSAIAVEVVLAVARKGGTYYSGECGMHFCIFCKGKHNYVEMLSHDQDCIVLKARAMVQNMPHMEAIE